ncbi:hypothetical protein Leryth_017573 [Lithospermum erythrorhizon]|nr:hypothetical protein Leryth_017573 [Lithospermum erythrorhizon]
MLNSIVLVFHNVQLDNKLCEKYNGILISLGLDISVVRSSQCFLVILEYRLETRMINDEICYNKIKGHPVMKQLCLLPFHFPPPVASGNWTCILSQIIARGLLLPQKSSAYFPSSGPHLFVDTKKLQWSHNQNWALQILQSLFCLAANSDSKLLPPLIHQSRCLYKRVYPRCAQTTPSFSCLDYGQSHLLPILHSRLNS